MESIDWPIFPLALGASDAGFGSGHVHPIRNRRFSGSHHIHEELGREPTRQEVQEAAGLHLPHQERGET